MAKRLSEHTFRGQGRPNQYPWDQWLNGDIWQLQQGEDFWCSTSTMVDNARKTVRRNHPGHTLRTETNPAEGLVVIQKVKK